MPNSLQFIGCTRNLLLKKAKAKPKEKKENLFFNQNVIRQTEEGKNEETIFCLKK
jgi:hypothetical protein